MSGTSTSASSKVRGNYLNYLLIFISLILLLCLLNLQTTSAKPTQSSSAISDSIWNAYYDDLFYSDFSDRHLLIFNSQYGGSIGVSGGEFYIDTDLGPETNPLTNYPMAYATTDSLYDDERAYSIMGNFMISCKFKPLSNQYDNIFWIVRASHCGLIICGDLNIGIGYEEESSDGDWGEMQYSVTDIELTNGQYYIIWFWVWFDSENNQRIFEVYIDETLEYVFSDCENHNLGFAPSYLMLGDENSGMGQGKGDARWDWIRWQGHTMNRFFDNFEDGDPYNWRNIVKNSLASKWEVQSSHLYIFSTTSASGISSGETPYIDYEPDDDYISIFDFYPTVSNDYFVVWSNNEIILVYERGTLKRVYNDNWANRETIYSMTINQWYQIKIFKYSLPSEVGYYVFINQVMRGHWDDEEDFFDYGNGNPWVTIGDTDTFNQKCSGAYWDNFLLYDGIELSDSGFSDLFLDNPYTLFFEDDFEGSVSYKEYGYSCRPFGYTYDSNPVWSVGSGVGGQHSGNKVAKTILSNGYYPPSQDGRLVLPRLDFSNLDDAVITFAIWYDTIEGVDGCRIEYRQKQGVLGDGHWTNWEVLGALDEDFYNKEYVSEFGGPAFSGAGTWSIESTLLEPLCGHGVPKDPYEICFHFKSATYSTYHYGILVDDIQIYGRVDDSGESDFDNDWLDNWREFYTFKSSPFIKDTDGDNLDDYTEVSDIEFNKVNPTNLEPGPADPCTRDVFIEVDSMMSQATRGAQLLTAAIMAEFDSVVTSFKEHDINVHILYDQCTANLYLPYYAQCNEIPQNPNDDLTIIRDLNRPDNPNPAIKNFDDNRRYIYYHCMIVNDIKTTDYQQGGVWGIAYYGPVHAVFAIAKTGVPPRPNVHSVGESFMHELGHDLNCNHYSSTWGGWQPEYIGAGISCMDLDVNNRPYEYLEDKSDWFYKNNHINQGQDYFPYNGWESHWIWVYQDNFQNSELIGGLDFTGVEVIGG